MWLRAVKQRAEQQVLAASSASEKAHPTLSPTEIARTTPCSSAQVCSENWVAEERVSAAREMHNFLLVEDPFFEEAAYSYAVGIRVPQTEDASTVTLLLFASSKLGSYEKIYEEEIPTLLPELAPPPPVSCILEEDSPWFDATVVDLDGNGRQEIVVESNEVGGCSSCLSEVRVYQVTGTEVRKLLEESFSNIEFGESQGLALQSFRRGASGEFISFEQKFFTPDDHQRNSAEQER
jgi:hypothetical protein